MAQLTAGTGFRFDDLDVATLLDGTVTSASSTQFSVDIGRGYMETFTGNGFTFDAASRPVGGTITGIRETLSGAMTFEIAGLNTPMGQFNAWAETGANGTAFATMFGGNDNMNGSPLADGLHGYAGHDNIFGGSGADMIDGGDGNDHLYGQSAGGGADEGDVLLGGDGSDYLQGNAGSDTLDGAGGSDRIQGGADPDLAFGGDGNDSVNGNKGSDTILGNSGNDALRGGADNDSVSGGDGHDVLLGDAGADTLSGGAGFDIFQINRGTSQTNSPDAITDFTDGVDHFMLRYQDESVSTYVQTPREVRTGSADNYAEAQNVAVGLMEGNPANGIYAAVAVGSDTYVFYSATPFLIDSAFKLDGVAAAVVTVDDFV